MTPKSTKQVKEFIAIKSNTTKELLIRVTDISRVFYDSEKKAYAIKFISNKDACVFTDMKPTEILTLIED